MSEESKLRELTSDELNNVAGGAGTPGEPNCHGQTVSALAKQFGGTSDAATALGFSSVSALQDTTKTFCAC